MVAIESEPSLSAMERMTRKQQLYAAWAQLQQQSMSNRIPSTSQSSLPTFEPTVLKVVGKSRFDIQL